MTCRDFPSLVVAMSTGAVAIRSPLFSFRFFDFVFPCPWGGVFIPFAFSVFSSRFFEFLSVPFLGGAVAIRSLVLCSLFASLNFCPLLFLAVGAGMSHRACAQQAP